MNIIFDVLTLAIIVLLVYKGYRKGLFRTIASIVGLLLAYVCAFVFSKPIGDAINNSCVNKIVTDKVSDAANNSLGEYLSNIPNSIGGLSINAQDSGDKIISQAVNSISAPVSEMISRMIGFVIILIVVVIIVKIIAGFSDILKHVPVIGTLNAVAGALLGAVQAILIIFILDTVITISIPMLSLQTNPVITQKTINSTIVYKFFDQVNPLNTLLLKK